MTTRMNCLAAAALVHVRAGMLRETADLVMTGARRAQEAMAEPFEVEIDTEALFAVIRLSLAQLQHEAMRTVDAMKALDELSGKVA